MTLVRYVIDRPMRTRDALEPLLGAFDMMGAERDGRVALVGVEPVGTTVALEALALGDKASGLVRERVLEARAEAARVRFIDDGVDYQTGSVVVRADEATGAGGVDVDFPAVCGTGLAEALARRTLAADGADRLTLALGPVEALRLEPGDTVAVEGETGAWRVERVSLDETPTARLARRVACLVGEDDGPTRWPGGAELPGVPFVRVLDLPGLPGGETDRRPIVIAAGEPWRPMAVHVGEMVDALTQRGIIETPATVGRLMADLRAGPVDRWDEVNTLVVALEGAAPMSASDAAVLGSANLLAVESEVGWEVLSFRDAALVQPGVWRLSGLLRGRQGTEREAEAGAAAGATVVLLNGQAARVDLEPGERRLDRVARIGPVGAVPGGAGFAEAAFRFEGVVDRPWSPAGLRVVAGEGGLSVRWLPRVRVGGDRWDIEPAEIDARRFRVRVLDGGVERRVFEVEGLSTLYAEADLATDFPGGPGEGARLTVAQYGADWGWGREALCSLAA